MNSGKLYVNDNKCCKRPDRVDLTQKYHDMQVCLNCGQFYWMVNPQPRPGQVRMTPITFEYIKEELYAIAK